MSGVYRTTIIHIFVLYINPIMLDLEFYCNRVREIALESGARFILRCQILQPVFQGLLDFGPVEIYPLSSTNLLAKRSNRCSAPPMVLGGKDHITRLATGK